MTESVIADLRMKVQPHVLVADTQFVLADCLFSPDQLPRGYHLTHELAGKLWAAAPAGEHLIAYESPANWRKPDVSCRTHVMCSGQSPPGKPCSAGRRRERGTASGLAFRVIEIAEGRDPGPLASEAAEAMRPLFQGCAFEVLSPEGFFSAWRMADRLARPYAMHATVNFLHSGLNIPPAGLRAVVLLLRSVAGGVPYKFYT